MHSIIKEISKKLNECVNDLMASPKLLRKTETKYYALGSIYKDMESIIKMIVATQSDYLAIQIHESDFTLVYNKPEFEIKEEDEPDEEIKNFLQIDQYSFEADEEDC
ncbi:hypothetical protein M9Y10_035031 [Tritrichomonas musculus]|uniref:Uncharacterized protein n=1 Tax=Tritrichomonas musculus TaxID=1915356 RepID=A0ABR2KGI5_9EUKA